jgi:hypothetical protein
LLGATCFYHSEGRRDHFWREALLAPSQGSAPFLRDERERLEARGLVRGWEGVDGQVVARGKRSLVVADLCSDVEPDELVALAGQLRQRETAVLVEGPTNLAAANELLFEASGVGGGRRVQLRPVLDLLGRGPHLHELEVCGLAVGVFAGELVVGGRGGPTPEGELVPVGTRGWPVDGPGLGVVDALDPPVQVQNGVVDFVPKDGWVRLLSEVLAEDGPCGR